MGFLREVCLVGVGGGIGAGLRLLVGKVLLHHYPNAWLPIGTLSVNLLGCFCIGAVAAYLTTLEPHRMGLQLFFITGVLGGFTTFSAFGLELFTMLRKEAYGQVLSYISLSVIAGLVLVMLGWGLVKRIL